MFCEVAVDDFGPLERTAAWIVATAQAHCLPQALRAADVTGERRQGGAFILHAYRPARARPELSDEFNDGPRDAQPLVSLATPVGLAQRVLSAHVSFFRHMHARTSVFHLPTAVGGCCARRSLRRIRGPRHRASRPRATCIYVSALGVEPTRSYLQWISSPLPINHSCKLTSTSVSLSPRNTDGLQRGRRAILDCARDRVHARVDPGAARDRGPPPRRPPVADRRPRSSRVRIVAGSPRRCSGAFFPMLRARAARYWFSCLWCDSRCGAPGRTATSASLAQLTEHALHERMVVGPVPAGGSCAPCGAARSTFALHFGASAPVAKSRHRAARGDRAGPIDSAPAQIDTCGVRARAGRPRRLSRRTP